MIRKTAPLAVIFGLVCVALILPQFIELGQAQDEPPGPTTTQDESLPALTRPVAEVPAPAEKAPATGAGMTPGGISTGVPAAASQPSLLPVPATPMGPQPSIGSATGPMAPGAVRLPGPAMYPSVTSGAGPTVPDMYGGPVAGYGGPVAGEMSGMMGQAGAAIGGVMGAAVGQMVQGPSGPQFQQRLAEETQKLLQAATPEEKQQATEALGSLLGEYFDSDMQRRQADLDKVKQRVARLEELLNKRQAAKQEIVDLQLRTMVNESEGLGFFSTPAPGQPGALNDPNYSGGYGMESFGGGLMAPGNMPGMPGGAEANGPSVY